MMEVLPNELIDDIFSFISIDDLVRLSLVCKSIHWIIEPYLYRAIHVRIVLTTEETQKKTGQPLDSKCTAYLLLRTLRSRPELWGFVKELSAVWDSVRNHHS